jgi:hypothetical protein
LFKNHKEITTMKTTNISSIAFALSIIIATLTGCGNDAPVRQDGVDGTGGSGGNGNGNPPEGTCYDSNGKPCTGAGSTGNNWAVISGDVFQADPYNTWSWVSSQNDAFATCFNDSACKAKIVANDPSVRWQFLGDGNYSEAYKGSLGMFNLGRSASSCGYNIQIQSATTGLCWGEIKLSTGGRETFKTQKAVIGYDSGDACKPGAIIALCENAITVSQYESGTTPPSPTPQSFNGDSGSGDGFGYFYSRVWGSDEQIARANSLNEMFAFKTIATVQNSRSKIQAPKADIKLPEGKTAREVTITNDGVKFLWDDGSVEFKSNATIEHQGFAPSDG